VYHFGGLWSAGPRPDDGGQWRTIADWFQEKIQAVSGTGTDAGIGVRQARGIHRGERETDGLHVTSLTAPPQAGKEDDRNLR
jgi:hypothetical protein